MLDKAIALAATKFKGIFDKGGKPYILHCLWVMDKVRHLGEDYMIVAVLHDIIEDTSIKRKDLREMGYPPHIISAICLLSKEPGENYLDRIQLISNNKYARQVKLRDLEHNSKITRLKDVRPSDLARAEKYHKAYKMLEKWRK
jgi:hypothetical protein